MRNLINNIASTLTADEKEVISVLVNVAREKAPGMEPRIAGGWVRDKMLGVPSDDIDVMTDQVSGQQFASWVALKLGIDDPAVFKINPEKSKHLETAEIKIPVSSGQTYVVQFAGARKEVYTADSRIPTVEKASPQGDAMRRDLTINALFYNTVTQKVEDMTGQGIKDLISNTIRTPLDPLKTFTDDPLRMFRVIRFAAKYKGNIDPQTLEALKNPQLKVEMQKISKDRIGKELKKTFENPNAEIAISLLKDTGLLDHIMSESLKGTKYEGKMAPLDMNQDNPNHKLNWWSHTFEVLLNTLKKFPQYEGEQRVIMVLAALTHDMGKLFDEIRVKKPGSDKHPGHEQGYTTYVGHEEESYEIVQHILKYLKLEPFIQQVAGLARYHMMPHSLVRDNGGDKALRKFIRRMGEFSLNWLDVLNLSIADAYSKDKNVSPETIKDYQELERRLQAAMASLSPEATATPKIKPILDGNEIMSILGVKPGPHMKEMGEFVKELMDDNPAITKEEAAAKLKEKFQPATPATPTAGEPIQTKASAESKESTCSMQVLQQKMGDIQDLIDADKLYEATSVMSGLKEKYGNDEKVTRLIAINTFKCLTKNKTSVGTELIQYILDKASENFFDSVLNAYAFGLLVMVKTSTDSNVVKEVASRVRKMSPGTLRFVVTNIPKTSIVNTEAALLVKEFLDTNYRSENE